MYWRKGFTVTPRLLYQPSLPTIKTWKGWCFRFNHDNLWKAVGGKRYHLSSIGNTTPSRSKTHMPGKSIVKAGVMKIKVVKTIRLPEINIVHEFGKFRRFPEQCHFWDWDSWAVGVQEYVKPYKKHDDFCGHTSEWETVIERWMWQCQMYMKGWREEAQP